MAAYAKFNLLSDLRNYLSSTNWLGVNPEHHVVNPGLNYFVEWLNGVGVDQIDTLYMKQHTILTGGSQAFTLSGNALKDVFNANCNLVTVCAVMVINDLWDVSQPDNTTNLTLGAGANPFLGLFGVATGFHTIRPGGVFFEANAKAGGLGTVVNGTGDTINLVNAAGATNNCQVLIAGRSA